MVITKVQFALLAVGLLAGQAALAADPSGAMLGRTCAGCHGTDGVSKGAAPSIKGLPASYMDKAMKDFKSGQRPSTIMGRIAKGYSDTEIAAMSEFFASIK